VTLVFGVPLRVAAGDYTDGTARLRADVAALLEGIRQSRY
jgi:hypothetical protein